MNNIIKLKKWHLIGVLTTLLFYSCVPTQKAIREENKVMPEHYRNNVTDTINSSTVKLSTQSFSGFTKTAKPS